MATASEPTLSVAGQEKAQRKIAINGSAAMVCYALATVLSVQANSMATWLSIIAAHAAMLATIAAFVWPLYLLVLEKRRNA